MTKMYTDLSFACSKAEVLRFYEMFWKRHFHGRMFFSKDAKGDFYMKLQAWQKIEDVTMWRCHIASPCLYVSNVEVVCTTTCTELPWRKGSMTSREKIWLDRLLRTCAMQRCFRCQMLEQITTSTLLRTQNSKGKLSVTKRCLGQASPEL